MPNIFETADDYTFIVCEFVLPASEDDFKHLMGLTFDEFKEFLCMVYNEYSDRNKHIPWHLCMSETKYIHLLETNEEVRPIYDYLTNTGYDTVMDLLNLSNWGLANREGYPYLVILDNGYNKEIGEKFYHHDDVRF